MNELIAYNTRCVGCKVKFSLKYITLPSFLHKIFYPSHLMDLALTLKWLFPIRVSEYFGFKPKLESVPWGRYV